jgi:FlaA1/EpsC-like NDP-sugar epimerase
MISLAMISDETLRKVLARESSPLNNFNDLALLQKERVLLTGASGSLGVEISALFQKNLVTYLATDIETCDVTNLQRVTSVVHEFQPTLIVHLAADKHAPQGELSPFETFDINTNGTQNVIAAKNSLPKTQSCRIVLASTCKSCDPETVYGASKLIAERLILNDGGSVARFFNVVETAGNVFQIWDELDPKSEIEVTPCSRYFISAAEATSLLIRVMALGVDKTAPKGRFSFNPGPITYMPDLAKELFPGRTIKLVAPRRGDRLNEPLVAKSEKITEVTERLWQVSSPHDATHQFD